MKTLFVIAEVHETWSAEFQRKYNDDCVPRHIFTLNNVLRNNRELIMYVGSIGGMKGSG